MGAAAVIKACLAAQACLADQDRAREAELAPDVATERFARTGLADVVDDAARQAAVRDVGVRVVAISPGVDGAASMGRWFAHQDVFRQWLMTAPQPTRVA